MGKVKVNKELFEALEFAENKVDGGLTKVIALFFDSEEYANKVIQPIYRYEIEYILEIHKYGYELEETPEEKALEYYKRMCPLGTYTRMCVQEILDILDIKVKGINE